MWRWNFTSTKRADVLTPLFQLRKPRRLRAAIVSDVVNEAAEGIDFEHAVALRAGQNAHGGVERTAAGARLRGRGSFGLCDAHARLACAAAACGAPLTRPMSPSPTPSNVQPRTSGLFKWTFWLSGSRFCKQCHKRLREPPDHRRLERETQIFHLRRQRASERDQLRGLCRQFMQTREQIGRRSRCGQRRHIRSMPRHCILRDIDAVEIAIIFAAILRVIDDLQSRAKRVVRGPCRFALAMHVENVTADRRGRIRAIMHQLVEIGVARLRRVHAERIEQIERVARRQFARGEHGAQRLGDLDPVVLAEQRRFETVEPRDLLIRRQIRAVGYIVSSAHEIIESKHGRPMLARDQDRGDGEILVAMRLRCLLFDHVVHLRYPCVPNQARASSRPFL